KLAIEAVRKYQAGGPVESVKQDPALVTKAPKIKKEQGLIDWSKPAESICRHVRAMQPWPTAYTWLHRPGREPVRVIVSKVKSETCPIDFGQFLPQPGCLFGVNTIILNKPVHGLWVAATGRADMVEILELQPAGKKKMTAEEFVRGHPIVEGARFGPE